MTIFEVTCSGVFKWKPINVVQDIKGKEITAEMSTDDFEQENVSKDTAQFIFVSNFSRRTGVKVRKY